MPLSRDRKITGRMDTRIYIYSTSTARNASGGPSVTTTQRGPYWAFVEYLTRKQGEIEVATRITSIQQVRFTIRYSSTVFGYLEKNGKIEIVGDTERNYEIISISKDKGRNQFIEIVTELKE